MLRIFGNFAALKAVELLLRGTIRYKNATIGLPKGARGKLGNLALAAFTALIRSIFVVGPLFRASLWRYGRLLHDVEQLQI